MLLVYDFKDLFDHFLLVCHRLFPLERLIFGSYVFGDVKAKAWVFGMVLGEILIEPDFDFALIVESDHLGADGEVLVFGVEVEETHQTLKQNVNALLVRDMVYDLIDRN